MSRPPARRSTRATDDGDPARGLLDSENCSSSLPRFRGIQKAKHKAKQTHSNPIGVQRKAPSAAVPVSLHSAACLMAA
jgi:hypothetical protein